MHAIWKTYLLLLYYYCLCHDRIRVIQGESNMSVHKICRTVSCRCGQTKFAIDSPDVIRLVCYCKDCRGYYNTLNEHAKMLHPHHDDDEASPAAAVLDPWGGCDYIHIIYPSEMKVIEGLKNLEVCKIREKSLIKRFYTRCCYTPIFSMGGSNSCLLNSGLFEENDLPAIRFRIMGRQALSTSANNDNMNRPSISWSVPWSWFWTMPGRIPKTTKATPCNVPVEIPNEVKVLENFKQG
jgi:hypothetical protein